jgi:hypothetical protein
VLLAVFYVAILLLLFRQQRLGRSSTPLILGAFPAALLFLALPPLLPVLQLMQAFVRVTEAKGGAMATVLPFSFAITRTLRLAALEFLVAIAVAGALQWFVERSGRSGATTQESNRSKVSRRKAIVLASAWMAIPVGVLNYVIGGIPKLVTAVASSTGPAAGETVQMVSQRIAGQLILSAFGGCLIAGIVAVLACANIRAVRSVPRNDSTARYVWAALYVSSVWAIWSAV